MAKVPLVVVVQETGPTAELTDETLESVGCVFALHAATARYAVVKALKDSFNALHQDSHTRAVRERMATFEEYNHVLGMDQWLALERQFTPND